MNRYLVLVLVIGVVLLSSWASGDSVGATSACENGQCIVSASTSSLSIFIAAAIVAFMFLYRQQVTEFEDKKIVGVWRRFGAFYLDFMFVLLALSPLAALPMVFAESGFTGEFQWSFEREFSRPTDSSYLLSSIFSVFVGLYYYFYKHGQLNRPTIGQYVLNYKVVRASSEEVPLYGRRVLFSFFGLCACPISLVLALRRSDKAFWWDKVTKTRVVRVSAVNKSVQADQPSAGR